MKKKLQHLIVPAILFLCSVAFARHLPPELTFPPMGLILETNEEETEEETNEDADTLTLEMTGKMLVFSTSQTYFDRAYSGINNVFYNAMLDNVYAEQMLRYEFHRDRLENTRQHINASGEFKYALEKYSWFTPGLNWTPVMQYSNNRGEKNSLATLDIGPNADLDVFGIPVSVRGGLSTRRVDSHALETARNSAGVYGAFDIGSFDTPLPFVPIYFTASGIGRQIENTSMTALSAAMVGAQKVGLNDSVFIYAHASLFDGREGYLESSADGRVARFVDTPWRIEQSAGTTIGYKGDEILIFYPTVYYGVNIHTLEFLNDARRRDELTLRQTLSGAISTDTGASLIYSGSITFEWRDHDKLFNATLSNVATSENRDSLNVNLWDHNSFEPRTTQTLGIKLIDDLWLKYDFNANRFLTLYPNYYADNRDTIRNNDDSDRRTLAHRLAFVYGKDSTLSAEIFGELIRYDLVFLNQAKSSSNRTDNTERVGLNFSWLPSERFLIRESVIAEAKRGDFHFPQFHQSALSRPRYSRAISSSLSGLYRVTPIVAMKGAWSVKFSDYGFWYGREYMTDVLAQNPNAQTDFYAITSKSTYHTLDGSMLFDIFDGMFECGSAVTFARDRNYESGNYILTNEHGLTVKPYVGAKMTLFNRVEFTAHLSRTLVEGSSSLDFWDFRLRAQGGF